MLTEQVFEQAIGLSADLSQSLSTRLESQASSFESSRQSLSATASSALGGRMGGIGAKGRGMPEGGNPLLQFQRAVVGTAGAKALVFPFDRPRHSLALQLGFQNSVDNQIEMCVQVYFFCCFLAGGDNWLPWIAFATTTRPRWKAIHARGFTFVDRVLGGILLVASRC